MDPNEAYKQMVAALESGDLASAAEHAENLYDWLNNGGFLPALATTGDKQYMLACICYALFTGIAKDDEKNLD